MNMKKTVAMFKLFTMLAGCTLGLFIALGIGGLLQSKWAVSPIASMKGVAATLSNHFFIDMMAMELPSAERERDESFTFKGENIASFMFRFLTDIEINNPKSFIAMEVPGLSNERAYMLRGNHHPLTYPVDYTPSISHLLPHETNEDKQDTVAPDTEGNEDIVEPEPDSTSNQPTIDDKSVFIYHSHNRESWVPELPGVTEINDAYDPEINVTLLGNRMAEKLEQLGIGAISSNTDYPSNVADFNYNFSYKYSQTTVREASSSYPQLQYYFDIHRDSQRRDLTTVTIDGEEYAQLFFIIGQKNPNWEKNEAFAAEIHARIEEAYPGLSRGIWGKTANTGHAEYNQSISPNSILVEVGGPENTLAESYRTIEILAEVVADYYWEQQEVEKVDASA